MRQSTVCSFACLALLAAGCTSLTPSINIADDAAVVAYEEAFLGRMATRSPPGFVDQGDGVVGFTLFPDGSVGGVAVIESSGSAVLDARAVEIIRLSAPFPPPPTRLSAAAGFPVRIPFRFRWLERPREHAV